MLGAGSRDRSAGVLVAQPPLQALPKVAWCMKFDHWLFWAAFLGFLGCNVGLLVWVLLG
jgi:hypothetical protein